jgi:hypothetical protein
MAILINDNYEVNVGKPIDSKYLNGQLPWSSVLAANTGIPISYRYSGLTVLVRSGTTNVEYWYKNGLSNGSLIEKKYDSVLPLGDYVTGGTNIGYFSGYTGVQTLPIDNLTDNTYDGNYLSLYNYYYRDVNGIITIGTPSDNIPKRGYVKNVLPNVKSWIWNEYLGSGNKLGWILISGSIADQIGSFQPGVTYYGTSTSYTGTSWTTGNAYNNASNVVINTVTGSLTTGSTITIGGPVFDFKEHNNLHFRTIMTKTPDIIKVTNDSAFVYLSGTTGNQLLTASNGLNKVGQDVRLGGRITGTTVLNLTGSSSLTFTDSRVTPVGTQYAADYSASFTPRSLVDRGYVDSKTSSPLGGERIFKTISQVGHPFSVGQVVGWSGFTYNKPIANGTYDGEVLGVVTNCFNANCFELTQAGYVSGLTLSPPFITNCTYFLSASIAGCLTVVEPSTANYLSKSMLIATSPNSAWILPYAAYVISSGLTEGGPLIKSVCIPGTTYVVKNTDYYIGACNNSSVILPLAPKVGMIVVVSDVGVMPDVASVADPIVITGSIIGGAPSACIDTAYGSLTFINTCASTCWSVIGFSPAP